MNINKFKLVNHEHVGHIKINNTYAIMYFLLTHALFSFLSMLSFNVIRAQATKVTSNFDVSILLSYAMIAAMVLVYVAVIALEVKFPIKRYHNFHSITHYLYLTAGLPIIFVLAENVSNIGLLFALCILLGFITAREMQISANYLIHSKKYAYYLVLHSLTSSLTAVVSNYLAHPFVVIVLFLALEGLSLVNLIINKPLFELEEYNEYKKWMKQPLDFSSNQERKRHQKFWKSFSRDKFFVILYIGLSVASVIYSQVVINYAQLSYSVNFLLLSLAVILLMLSAYIVYKFRDKLSTILLWLFGISAVCLVIPFLAKNSYSETVIEVALATQMMLLIYLLSVTYINVDISYNLFNLIKQVTNLCYIFGTMHFVQVKTVSGDLMLTSALILCSLGVMAYFLLSKISFPNRWDAQ